MVADTTSTTPVEPKRRRGVFGFLFKTALGLSAFAFGCLIALVLLLPTILGPFVRSNAPAFFAEQHKGSIEVGEVHLAWFQPQAVRGIVLRDPDGVEVARASAELPPLFTLARSGGARFGRIALAVDMNLVADDAGVTNLERAIEPERTRSREESEDDEGDEDPIDTLARLDLDLEITSSRLAWSDAETRRVGVPFEIRDLRATVRARPDEPLVVHAGGKVVADSPGALEIDAKINRPTAAGRTRTSEAAWPFGKIDAKGRIEGFSSAMVDRLAGLQGDLEDTLGPRFDLRFTAAGVTPDSGELSLVFTSKKASVSVAGRFEGGALLGSGESSLLATVVLPRAFLTRYVNPLVPAGATLAFGEATNPWTVRVSHLQLPVPEPFPRAGGWNLAALAPTLEKLACEVQIELPGTIGFENEATRAARITPSVGDLTASLRVAPGQALSARVEAALDTGKPGKLAANLEVDDSWGPLARGDVPPLDVVLELTGVSTTALDALAGRPGLLVEAIGPELRAEVRARDANRESGTLTVAVQAERLALDMEAVIADGTLKTTNPRGAVLTLGPAPGWLETQVKPHLPEGMELTIAAGKIEVALKDLVFPLPEPAPAKTAATPAPLAVLHGAAFDLSCALPGVQISNAQTRAANRPFALSDLALRAHLATDGKLGVTLSARVGAEARSALTVGAQVALADLNAAGGRLPVGAQIEVKGLPTEMLDVFAGKSGLVSKLLGPAVETHLKVIASDGSGDSFEADLRTATTELRATGKLEPHAFVLTGDGLALESRLPPSWVEEQVSAFLPAGAKLSVSTETKPLALRVTEARIPLAGSTTAPASSPSKSGAPVAAGPAGSTNTAGAQATTSTPTAVEAVASRAELLEQLAEIALKLELSVPTLAYTDPATAAAGKPLALSELRATVEIAPEKPPFARIDGRIGAQANDGGTLELEIRALDPLAKLAAPDGVDTFRASLQVRAKEVPVALVDAIAKQDGLLVDALGARAELEAASESLSLAQGSFVVDFRSDQQHAVHAEGHIAEREIVIDKVDGLLARVNLGPLVSERIVGSLVPMLVQMKKPSGEPIVIALDELAYPLSGDLSQLDAVVRIDLGEVSYDLLPGLTSLLGDVMSEKKTRLPALTIPIEKGVARYDRLPIRIGGHEVAFAGSFSLVDKSFHLSTEVPLAALGKKVNAELERVRGLLSPDLAVPIEIRGTWRKPKVSIGDDFLKKVIEDAAGNQLEGFLKDAFKKKKKD